MNKYFSLIIILTVSGFLLNCTGNTGTTTDEISYPPPVAVDTILENGLEIKDTHLGSGAPVDSGYYFNAHYIGYLSNGEIFDSSYERNTPINFQLGYGQMIQSWEQGIKGMRAGGKRTITTPSELAYGANGIPGIIPANETLTFEIEMLEVVRPPKPWDLGSTKRQSINNNIEYVIVTTGQGNRPSTNDQVVVHYSGYLSDGTLFDSSLLRDDPFSFRLGTGYVIPGWETTIADMRPGEKRTVFIPPSLAYGVEGIPGTIPANATLRFDIELIEIIPANP